MYLLNFLVNPRCHPPFYARYRDVFLIRSSFSHWLYGFFVFIVFGNAAASLFFVFVDNGYSLNFDDVLAGVLDGYFWAFVKNGPKVMFYSLLVFFLSQVRSKFVFEKRLAFSVAIFGYFLGASALNVFGTLCYAVGQKMIGGEIGGFIFQFIPSVVEGVAVGLVFIFSNFELLRKNTSKSAEKFGVYCFGAAILVLVNAFFFLIHASEYDQGVLLTIRDVFLLPAAGFGFGIALAGKINTVSCKIFGDDSLLNSPCPMNDDGVIFFEGGRSGQFGVGATHVVFVGAHPDDIELGAYSLFRNDVKKHYVLLTHGELGASSQQNSTKLMVDKVWLRVVSAINSAKDLGCASITVASLSDGSLFLSKGAIIKLIRARISRIRAVDRRANIVIVGHCPFDLHSDHLAAYEALRSAARPNCTLFYMLINVSASPEIDKKLVGHAVYCAEFNFPMMVDHLEKHYKDQIERKTIDVKNLEKFLTVGDRTVQRFIFDADSAPVPAGLVNLRRMTV